MPAAQLPSVHETFVGFVNRSGMELIMESQSLPTCKSLIPVYGIGMGHYANIIAASGGRLEHFGS